MTPTVDHRNILGDRVTLQEVESETLVYDEHSTEPDASTAAPPASSGCVTAEISLKQIADKTSTELDSTVNDELVLLTFAALREQVLLQPIPLKSTPPTVSPVER